MRFPRPDEVEAATPPERDRAIDVIRITALVGVVVGHTVMATSTIRDGVFVWTNLLTVSPVFQALTWVFQIMPLFFFAGVAASVQTWTPGARVSRVLSRYRGVASACDTSTPTVSDAKRGEQSEYLPFTRSTVPPIM